MKAQQYDKILKDLESGKEDISKYRNFLESIDQGDNSFCEEIKTFEKELKYMFNSKNEPVPPEKRKFKNILFYGNVYGGFNSRIYLSIESLLNIFKSELFIILPDRSFKLKKKLSNQRKNANQNN